MARKSITLLTILIASVGLSVGDDRSIFVNPITNARIIIRNNEYEYFYEDVNAYLKCNDYCGNYWHRGTIDIKNEIIELNSVEGCVDYPYMIHERMTATADSVTIEPLFSPNYRENGEIIFSPMPQRVLGRQAAGEDKDFYCLLTYTVDNNEYQIIFFKSRSVSETKYAPNFQIGSNKRLYIVPKPTRIPSTEILLSHETLATGWEYEIEKTTSNNFVIDVKSLCHINYYYQSCFSDTPIEFDGDTLKVYRGENLIDTYTKVK